MNRRRISLTLSILFILFSLLTSIDCKREDKGDDPDYFRRVEESKAYLKAHIQDKYEISETSKTKEEAVIRFIESIQKGETEHYIFTKDEYLNIFLPNTLEENTLSTTMPLDEAWKIADLRRYIAIEKIQNSLKRFKGKSFKIETLTWRPEVRQLNVLKGHRVGNLVLKFGNETVELDQVRLVIEHLGKFKVCVIGS
ncbi:hypothetical protein [Leptospira andrefontaineae]|uniref:Uncharacterized protein n=1 Tax=Leptospira andrefontaineae TaxID=2484976 RepID=A0A4R9HA63_9LEPT|nr:hypothetical protein [Leptospira andrefontaineae]TGK43416.1 hypothetical protein EHO65_01870 [Leptospira andrefontaineae]